VSNAGLWRTFAQLVGNTLFYSNAGGTIQAVDIATGHLNWSVLLASSPFFQPGAVVAGGAIYAGDANGTVHAINAATGAPIWTLQTSGAPILPNI
jgi:outer membrane protein assembly factor BamB